MNTSASLQDADAPARRPGRRPVARPKKVVVVEENYPVNHPAFAEHDAKADAVVDSYESVRRYPTHLPDEDGGDENPSSNDVLGAPAVDQVALEDVPTASTEQREIDNSVPVVVGDSGPELPPGYRSKFPQRTFASDAGGSGDVLRLKPRKRINQYQAPPAPTFEEEEVEEVARQPEVSDEQLQAAPRPRHRPQAAPRRDEQPAEETEAAAVHTGPGAAARGRHRESHRVQIDEGAEPVQVNKGAPSSGSGKRDSGFDFPGCSGHQNADSHSVVAPSLTNPTQNAPASSADCSPSSVAHPSSPDGGPRLCPTPTRSSRSSRTSRTSRSTPSRSNRAPLPLHAAGRGPSRPVPQQRAEVQGGGEQDHAEEPQPAQPRPLRRRPRPRPRPVTAEEVDVGQDLDNALQTTATPPVRRRRPQAAGAGSRTVTEESFQVRGQQPQQERASRGHGRRLDSASSLQGLPQVQVEHDGTAKGHHEPTLVRSAVKKLSEGSHPGDPSPALIQK
ncbi:Endo-1,4-beta-xylanase 1, partial [Frankliniella fusca]